MEFEPFRRLIEANRMDQRTRSFPTYADLLHYCEHSANPVGHMVLALYGYHDARRKRLADATCTALQLTNFWQDVARDLAMGRIYIPLEDMARFGYTPDDLSRRVVDRRFKALMAFEAERTRELYREGLKLLPLLEGAAREQVELFSQGGMSVLDKVERAGFDVFRKRPELSKAAKLRFIARGLVRLRLRSANSALSLGGSR
jgi:squalene synthase HpnC